MTCLHLPVPVVEFSNSGTFPAVLVNVLLGVETNPISMLGLKYETGTWSVHKLAKLLVLQLFTASQHESHFDKLHFSCFRITFLKYISNCGHDNKTKDNLSFGTPEIKRCDKEPSQRMRTWLAFGLKIVWSSQDPSYLHNKRAFCVTPILYYTVTEFDFYHNRVCAVLVVV